MPNLAERTQIVRRYSDDRRRDRLKNGRIGSIPGQIDRFAACPTGYLSPHRHPTAALISHPDRHIAVAPRPDDRFLPDPLPDIPSALPYRTGAVVLRRQNPRRGLCRHAALDGRGACRGAAAARHPGIRGMDGRARPGSG